MLFWTIPAWIVPDTRIIPGEDYYYHYLAFYIRVINIWPNASCLWFGNPIGEICSFDYIMLSINKLEAEETNDAFIH